MFLGRRFIRGGDTPVFRHAFSNRTQFGTCGRFWLSFVQATDESKKEDIKQNNRGKPKSADDYNGRPNYGSLLNTE